MGILTKVPGKIFNFMTINIISIEKMALELLHNVIFNTNKLANILVIQNSLYYCNWNQYSLLLDIWPMIQHSTWKNCLLTSGIHIELL